MKAIFLLILILSVMGYPGYQSPQHPYWGNTPPFLSVIKLVKHHGIAKGFKPI